MKTDAVSTEVLIQGVTILVVAGISEIIGKVLQVLESLTSLLTAAPDRRLTSILGEAGGELLRFISSRSDDLSRIAGG
ncbi:MAG: hypothetical protein WC291_08805 [Thermodesulfovibrionales bacterium]|jgi:hypothetical protein